MSKSIKFEDFINTLISLGKPEIKLSMKREIKNSLDASRCKIYHILSYDEKAKYSFEHTTIRINDLERQIFAKLLHKDLTKFLEQGEIIKSKGIEVLLYLNGTSLPYLGQRDYLMDNGCLSMLSLPDLLMDIEKVYKLK